MRPKAPAPDPALLAALHEAARHQQAGELAKAAAMYRQILKRHPDHPDALHLLAMVSHLMGDTGAGVDLIRRVIKRYPDFPEAHNTLGNILKDQGDTPGAVACYQKAVALRPEQVSAHYNLGNCYRDAGNLEQAAACYRRAVGIDPEYAQAHNALGGILHDRGKLEEASACFRRALEIQPHYAEALNNFGILLKDRGEFETAVQCFERALAIRPKYSEAYNNLGAVLISQGKLEEAVNSYRSAIALEPSYAVAHSNLIFCMNYDPRYTTDNIWAESRRWGELHSQPKGPHSGVYANDPTPHRRLRIGYVSPDFRTHSVSYFFEPLLEAHGRDAVEVFCYAEVLWPDETTEHLKTLADHWRSTVGRSDAEIAERIQADGIDILVDLAGHSTNNRLGVFALKPAPVQVTWLGYAGTTGLPAIDYRFTDAVADPPGEADGYVSEELIRLSRGFHCYEPPADAPEVGNLPAHAKGFVTFGSFNNLLKVAPEVVETWAQIIAEVPGSHLFIKSFALAEAATERRYREIFAAHGIAPEVLEVFSPISSRGGHMALYGRIDVALDTFPYNGTTTTCEALWMGVPVVTLLGKRHAGRVGASLLTHLGLPELIAETASSYVDAAVALAGDLDRLGELREGLRRRMRASPLCDREGFAKKIEEAYRNLWRRWCESV